MGALLFADGALPLQEGGALVLPAGQVYHGNYFATGSSVEISGTVDGDVYVLAEQLVIDGIINGDVLATAGSIDISGKVMHNCRLAGGQILISGIVGGNISSAAGNLQLLPSASVGGGLVATAGNTDLSGNIDGDVTIAASNMRVASQISGSLQGYVGHMRITSKTVIGGNLDYRSNTEAWIDPAAVIRGTIMYRPSFVHHLIQGTWIHKMLVGTKVLTILMNMIYTLVIGLVLLKWFPGNLDAALRSLKNHPVKSLAVGFMLLIVLPLAVIVLLMTVLGVPFALTLMAVNIIGFYTAKVYSIFWASHAVFAKFNIKHRRFFGFFCGVLLYFCLTAIPVAGTLIAFVAMLFGLGSGILAQRTSHGIFASHEAEKKGHVNFEK